MRKEIPEEITVNSSKKKGRGIAISMLVFALLLAGYVALPQGWVELAKNHTTTSSGRLLFDTPYITQKVVGGLLLIGCVVTGVKKWRQAMDGRFILRVSRDGISDPEALVPWDAISEVHFYADGYLLVGTAGQRVMIQAVDADQKRDDVLEVVKRVKPK